MKNVKAFAQGYIDWVIKLGRLKFSLLGLVILAVLALCAQALLSLLFVGDIHWGDVSRSIIFGLISAPFVIYFFTLLVERLELSRLALARSVEELKRSQMEAKQQADFLRSFIDASPDLVFYRSEQHYFLGCNRAMELLTGKSEAELQALTPSQIFPEDAAQYILGTDQEILSTNQDITYEQWFKYPDGRAACFEIRKVPYFDQINQRQCLMGFGRDITERKRSQEMIEQASRDKTTLMATISHELRTPLNGIIGLSRILLDGKLDAEQRNYLQTIHVSAASLAHIFNDIIDLEKLDARRIEVLPKETELNALLNDIRNFATFMAQQKGLDFSLETEANLPDWLMLDATRLSQILWNLVSNAVKFTEQGRVHLKVEFKAPDQLCFALTDTGIGIEKEDLHKIFSLYYQAQSQPLQYRSMGSGIGLSISKRIANLMQGDLSVESEVGQGSIFRLQISAPVVQQPEHSQPATIGLKLKILLVEDIEVNVIVAKSVLEKQGYEVDVAMSGAEAIRKFEQNFYDLLLIDIRLPDMSGFEIAQLLRANYAQDKYDSLPPLIALTANVKRDKQEYQQQGMDDVLGKPLSVEELNHCLLNYFSDIENVQAPSVQENSDERFNFNLLNELKEMLGVEFLQQNLALFAQSMPAYSQDLEQAYQAWLKEPQQAQNLADIAHKIKGAAASVGLLKLQNIGQQAQSCELENWPENIGDWVQQLCNQWQQEVQALQDWLSKN